MIDIYVQRTLAKAHSNAPITSGSVGLEVQFQFSEDWNGLTKTAIFETDNYKEHKQIPESGVTTVPDSVLVYPGVHLRVGVYGKSANDEVVTPTVYADCGVIKQGANTTPVGTPPTPSQAEYLQSQIDELRESGVGGTVDLDTTLTQSGKAADAKAVGDALANVDGKAYVQSEEPVDAPIGALWYDTDEEVGEADSSPVESVNGKTGSVILDAADVGALPADTEIPTVPVALPNPNKLTFSGAVEAEYDGSSAVEVVIPEGGSSGGGEQQIVSFTVAEDATQIDIPITAEMAEAINAAREIFFDLQFKLPAADSATAMGKLTFGTAASWGFDWYLVRDYSCLPTNSASHNSQIDIVGHVVRGKLGHRVARIEVAMKPNNGNPSSNNFTSNMANTVNAAWTFRLTGTIPIGAGSTVNIFVRG